MRQQIKTGISREFELSHQVTRHMTDSNIIQTYEQLSLSLVQWFRHVVRVKERDRAGSWWVGFSWKKKNEHHQNSHMTQQPRRRCIKASSYLQCFLLACKSVKCSLTVLLTKSALVQRSWSVCVSVLLQMKPSWPPSWAKKAVVSLIRPCHTICWHASVQKTFLSSDDSGDVIRASWAHKVLFPQARAWDFIIYAGFWDRVEGSEVHCARPSPPPPTSHHPSPQSNTALNVHWNRIK